MIRHLLRLVWNRRRANVLIALEIFLSFLVLCAVVTMGLYYLDNYRRPLGFVWQDTWAITMDANDRTLPGAEADTRPAGTGPNSAQRALVARLLSTAGDLPEVESAAAAFVAPSDSSTWRSNIRVGGKRYLYLYNEATDDFAATLRMNVVRGRWFDTSDDGSDWTPAVINLRLAREMFGDEDPVGKLVEDEREPDPASPIQRERTRLRIVGVVDDFRKDGEYSVPGEFLIARNRLDDPSERVTPPRRLLVRVRPGTAADFEEKLVSRLRAVAPDWTFQSEPLELRRGSVARQLHRAARGVRRCRRLPADHGRAGPDRRAVAQRHAAHAGDRRAPGDGGQGLRRPAATGGRSGRPDHNRCARGGGGRGSVSAPRVVRRSAAGGVRGRPGSLAPGHLRADRGLRLRAVPAGGQRAARGGAQVRIGARG